MSKRILVWFRNDLRLHDNEVLTEALAKGAEILPVYIFDPRQFKETHWGSLKTGFIRANFLLESVAALAQSFKDLGGNLLVLRGFPEIVIPKVVADYQLNEVYHHREVAVEETMISSLVEDLLWKQKINLKHFIGHTLYNKKDLPFPIKDIPEVFTQFKRKIEREAFVKPCFEAPAKINFITLISSSQIPTLGNLYGKTLSVQLADQNFIGGEKEALALLDRFVSIVSNKSLIKKTEIISKISPWLALGCVSPRKVYWAIRLLENKGLHKQIYNQLVLGLLWRDYFRFMFKKHGNRFFLYNGFSDKKNKLPLLNRLAFSSWKNATTQNELVNTLMTELNETGYLTNVGRQIVATYLVHQLGVNWLYGAAYFEEKLIDYCPASNWGNWANMAGVGNDAHLTEQFTFEKVVKSFDGKMLIKQVTNI